MLDKSMNFLDAVIASEHDAGWSRERLLVFVPSLSTSRGANSSLMASAMKSVVAVTESPFLDGDTRTYGPMTDFVSFGSPSTENRDVARIRGVLRTVSERDGCHYEPRILHCQRADRKRDGIFMGTALFVPPDPNASDAQPRGHVELEIHDLDPRGNVRGVRATARPVFSDNARTPGGLFLGQDRIVFGVNPNLPVVLEASGSSQTLASWGFTHQTVILILPGNVLNDRPTLLITSAYGRVLQLLEDRSSGIEENVDEGTRRAGRQVPLTELLSITGPAGNNEDGIYDLDFSGASGNAEIDVSRNVSASDSRRTKAVIKIVPNSLFSRLRHTPEAVTASYFSILGLLLPVPVDHEAVDQVCLNFTTGGQLIGHAFDRFKSATLLRAKGGISLGTQRFGARLSAIDCGADGLRSERRMSGSEAFEPMNALHEMAIQISGGKSISGITNAIHGGSSQGFLNALSGKGFALLRPKTTDAPLGYFGCPTRFQGAETDLEAQDCQPSDVIMSRGRLTQGHGGICLDWLDEAVKIVPSDGGDRDKALGFAEYWSQLDDVIPAAFRAEQRLELNPSETRGLHQLTLIEVQSNRREETRLEDGTILRLGPLICRYHYG